MFGTITKFINLFLSNFNEFRNSSSTSGSSSSWRSCWWHVQPHIIIHWWVLVDIWIKLPFILLYTVVPLHSMKNWVGLLSSNNFSNLSTFCVSYNFILLLQLYLSFIYYYRIWCSLFDYYHFSVLYYQEISLSKKFNS